MVIMVYEVITLTLLIGEGGIVLTITDSIEGFVVTIIIIAMIVTVIIMDSVEVMLVERVMVEDQVHHLLPG